MRPTPDKLRTLLASLRKRMNLRSLVVTLAAIVVFTTTYLLILPAFTLEKDEAIKQGGIDVVAEETAAMEATDAEADEEPVAETADVKEEAPAETREESPEKAKDETKGSDVMVLTKNDGLKADGEGFTVSAAPEAKTEVPAATELQVAEVKDGDRELNALRKEALSALKEDSADIKDIKEIKVYDMSLQADGESVSTDSKFNVKIEYEDGVKVEDADNIRVLTFDDQNKAAVLDTYENNVETKVEASGSQSSVTEASFDTEGISKVAVVEVETIEKTVITADGSTYKVTVRYDKNAQIPDGSTLDVKELTGDDYDAYLEKTADKMGKSAGELGMAKFFDITIKNGNDEVKIANPVDVEIQLLDSKNLAENTQVYHFENETKADLVDSKVTGDTVKFEAEGFSIYAIVDDNGLPQPPRVTFEFSDPNNPDFTFVDKAGHQQTTQIIKDGEKLQDVGLPTIPEGETFNGWFIYNGNTPVEAVTFDSAIAVAYGEAGAGSSLSASGITIDPNELNEDGTFHVQVKAFFGEVVYLTFYEDAAGTNILNRIQIPKGSEYNIATQTVNAPNSELAFQGWNETAGTNDDDRAAITSTTMTFNADDRFYPIFKSGHWITFYAGATGSGADYTAPVFVIAGDTAANAQPSNPEWKGYAFQYWTETNLYTGENGSYVRPTTAPTRFNFNSQISEAKTLYAYWTPADTTYTVVFWQQNVTDNKNATNAQKTYSFAEQITEHGTSGTTVPASNYAGRYTGYTINTSKSDTSVVVKADGTSIINVYFDRQLITMNFDRDITVYNPTTGTAGTQYAYVDGQYVQLTRSGSNWVYTTTEPVYEDYTGTRYNTTNVRNNNNPQHYGVVNGRSNPVELERRDNTRWYYDTTTYSWGTRYYDTHYVVNNSGEYGFVNGSMVELVDGKYQSGTQTVTHVYEGTRYTQGTSRSFTGLYGQTLAQNGYSWPSGYVWQYRDGNNNTQMSYLGQFVLPISGNTINFTSSGQAGKTFYFFLQNVDGSYPTTYSDRGYGTSTTATFYLSEKYDGFEVVSYQRGNTGNGRTGTWTSGADGGSVNISGYSSLGIRYQRKHFTLKYLDSVDNTELQGISNQDVVYGASLSGYKPASSFTPVSQYPGKVWDGKWYKDQACSEEFDWTITMPNADMVVYAGWENVYYKVDIDPNGGTLTEGESTIFWRTYGQTVQQYNDVVRDYAEDPNGNYKYEDFLRIKYETAGYDPWDYDGYLRTARYVTSDTATTFPMIPYGETEATGTFTYPYDSTRYSYEKGAYALIGWYELTFEDGHYGDLKYVTEEKLYNFGTGVTHDTYIQAKWRRVGEYHVEYKPNVYLMDADGNISTSDSGIETTNLPSDGYSYADQSQSSIMRSPDSPITRTVDGESKQYIFQGWYYNGQLYTPGDVFTVESSLAEDKVIGQDETTGEDIIQKTVYIYPVYQSVDDLPVDVTHIYWYSNWQDTDGNVIEGRTEANQFKDETNNELQPNEAVDIDYIDKLIGESDAYAGYTFKGWAKSPTARTPWLTYNKETNTFSTVKDGVTYDNVTQIAADETLPYEDLYAIWEINKYTVTVTKTVAGTGADQHRGFTFAPVFTGYTGGSNFILAGEETTVTDEDTGTTYTYYTSKEFTEVPYGATLTLTENEEDDYEATVKYTVTSNVDGSAIENPEEVDGTNGATYTIQGDITIAYTNTKKTQQVVIKKVDAQDNTKLLGDAAFTIDGNSYVTAKEGEDLGFTESFTLSAGQYEAVETNAPSGYNLPENTITITVNSGGVKYQQSNDNANQPQTAEWSDKYQAYVVTISNTAGEELPHTGGIGTTIFYILGSLLVIGCGIVLVSRRRAGANK